MGEEEEVAECVLEALPLHTFVAEMFLWKSMENTGLHWSDRFVRASDPRPPV